MLSSQLMQLDIVVLPTKYVVYLLVAGGIYFILFHNARKQRYMRDVPIVGGHDGESIRKNRLRFVNDSMAMLLEG